MLFLSRGASTSRPLREALKYEAAAPESLIERAALIAKTYPGVREVRFGYPTITYNDLDGTSRQHKFDFSSLSQSGHRVAVSVARDYDAERRLAPVIGLLNRQGLYGLGDDGSTRKLADFARLWTERDASTRQSEIARAILLSRTLAEETDVKAVRQLIKDIQLPVRLSKLLEDTNKPEVRQHSLWRLVDEGVLRVFPNEHGDIDHITIAGS